MLRIALLALCQVHEEHAVFEFGADVARAGVVRERKGAPETAGDFPQIMRGDVNLGIKPLKSPTLWRAQFSEVIRNIRTSLPAEASVPLCSN